MFKRSVARTALGKSLQDALTIFGADAGAQDPHLDRHLDAAVTDFGRVAPLLVSTTLSLVADVANYVAPADAVRFHSTELVADQNELPPWDSSRLQIVPEPFITSIAGARCWQFRPTPTNAMLAKLGSSSYPYTYFARHVLSEVDGATTIILEHQSLLVMRAQVESMREMAIRNAHKPIAVRDGMYSQTKNGTPAALADQFMRMWEQLVRPAADLYGTLRSGGGR